MLKVVENNLDTVIEPWSDPDEEGRRKCSVVDITGEVLVLLPITELLRWRRSIVVDEAFNEDVHLFINEHREDLREAWPQFITAVDDWHVVDWLTDVDESSQSYYVMRANVRPVVWESSQDIMEER